jgi:hypothetical protein
MLAGVRDWPITVWVVLLGVTAFLAEYVYLRVRHARYRTAGVEAERRLVRFATALRNYARDNHQALPATLAELNLPESRHVCYRHVPRLDLDVKLMVVHDAAPVHKVLEFPSLRDGRGVVFANGRLHVVSEEVFEKLIVADDALRERLGLEPVGPLARPSDEATGSAESGGT